MENMKIKNLLLVVLFMSAQLFGSDRVEDLFGVDSATINKGLVAVSALGVLAYIANSIRQVNQSRTVAIKEIVQRGMAVPTKTSSVLPEANRGEKRAEGEEPEIDSSRQEPFPETRQIRVNGGSLSGEVAGDEKRGVEEAVVALSPLSPNVRSEIVSVAPILLPGNSEEILTAKVKTGQPKPMWIFDRDCGQLKAFLGDIRTVPQNKRIVNADERGGLTSVCLCAFWSSREHSLPPEGQKGSLQDLFTSVLGGVAEGFVAWRDKAFAVFDRVESSRSLSNEKREYIIAHTLCLQDTDKRLSFEDFEIGICGGEESIDLSA